MRQRGLERCGSFGLKVGMAGTMKFEARIKELVGNAAELAALVEPLPVVRRVLRVEGRWCRFQREAPACE